jgi:hypothetical protein
MAALEALVRAEALAEVALVLEVAQEALVVAQEALVVAQEEVLVAMVVVNNTNYLEL